MQWPRFFKVYSLDFRFDGADSLIKNPRQAYSPTRYGLCRGATLTLPFGVGNIIDDIYEARICFDTVIAYQNSYYHEELGEEVLTSAFIGIGNQPNHPVAELMATPLDTTMNMLPFRLSLPGDTHSWLYNLPWQTMGESTKSRKYSLVYGRPELARVARIQTATSIDKEAIYRFGFNRTILEHSNLGTQTGLTFPLTKIEISADDIQQARQDAELIQFLPTISNLMVIAHAYPQEDIEAPLVSAAWPTRIEVISPVLVIEPGFANGLGEAEMEGRPRTNAAYIGEYQGVRGLLGYWIGPTEAGQQELYKFQELKTKRDVIEGITFELLCGPGYTPAEGDFSFLVSYQGEDSEMAWKEWSDLTLLQLGPAQGGSSRSIISTFVPLDPLTEEPWSTTRIKDMLFGIKVSEAPVTSPTDIKFAGLRIISVESEQERSHISRPNSIPIYKNFDPAFEANYLSESDTNLIYKPTTFRFYLDVKKPAVVAQASIIPPGRNMIKDGSFEILGSNADLSAWTLSGGAQAIFHGVAEARDARYSVCTPIAGSIEQIIQIPEEHWGRYWKLGLCTATVASTAGFVDATLVITYPPELYGTGIVKARMNSQSVPPNVWLERWSKPFIVPEAIEATLTLSRTGNGFAYFDLLVLGEAEEADFAWAWVEPFQFTGRGSIIVPIGAFISGSWDNLKPGMTIQAGQEFVRLREIHRQWGYLKVAENDIDWGSLTTINFLDEYRYWLRYQRMVALGFSPGGEEEERYRESQLERSEPSAPQELPPPV